MSFISVNGGKVLRRLCGNIHPTESTLLHSLTNHVTLSTVWFTSSRHSNLYNRPNSAQHCCWWFRFTPLHLSLISLSRHLCHFTHLFASITAKRHHLHHHHDHLQQRYHSHVSNLNILSSRAIKYHFKSIKSKWYNWVFLSFYNRNISSLVLSFAIVFLFSLFAFNYCILVSFCGFSITPPHIIVCYLSFCKCIHIYIYIYVQLGHCRLPFIYTNTHIHSEWHCFCVDILLNESMCTYTHSHISLP